MDRKLLTVLSAILFLAAWGDQATGYVHEENTCTMYGECGSNPDTNGRTNLNCVDNGPSRPMDDNRAVVLLQDLCPSYDPGNTCCDYDQLVTIQPLLTAMRPTFGRCPACLSNVETLICSIVCNANQSLYTNPTVFVENPEGMGVRVFDAFISETFANISYDSCKTVQFPAANTPVMDVMCGGYLGDECNPQRWYDFLGNTINGFIPWNIKFFLIHDGEELDNMDDTIVPMDPVVYFCDQPVGDQSACSCTDCERACPPRPTPGPTDPPFMVGMLKGNSFIILMVYCGLAALFILGIIVYECSRSSNDDDDDENDKRGLKNEQPRVNPDDVSRLDNLNKWMDDNLRDFFTWWGTIMASYPITVLLIALAVSAGLSCGFLFIYNVTDPVELWSGPNSRARLEMDYFDETFVPFYRSEIVYIKPSPTADLDYEIYDSYNEGNKTFGPMVNMDAMVQVLDLQKALESITADYNGKTIALTDICNKPLAPVVDFCLIQSVFQWYANSYEQLERVACDGNGNCANYRDHFLYCMKSPLGLEDNTPLKDMCVSQFGGPSYAYVVTGGYPDDDYNEAELLALTILVDNKKDYPEVYNEILAWEQEFLNYMKDYENENFLVSYYSERSIEDELLRQSQADVVTIIISYVVIFAYIALALGEFTRFDRLLIDSKITLGLGGVVIVLASVFTAIGLLSYCGVDSTLIVMEVVPFLILAIGADNIFIFVLDYQRDYRRVGETREQQIGRVLGNFAPSMLLCSLSESISFFLGCLTEMPAVRIFALYSGMSVLLNFVLQITAFVALLSLDARRQESGRLDILCCIPPRHKDPVPKKLGLLQQLMKKFFAPFILMKWVRPIVILVFGALTAFFTALALQVPIGLDQSLSMPLDSYVLDYFYDLGTYMKVGPPVYFVTTSGFNFSDMDGQNKVCGGTGCNLDSLTQQLYFASQEPEVSRIAQPTSSWMDDYFDWVAPQVSGSCCRKEIGNPDAFCPSKGGDTDFCRTCVPQSERNERLDPMTFEAYLPWFITDVPNEICNKGGSAAYGQAVQYADNSTTNIISTYFMTYHTTLITSTDFIDALKQARKVADSITESMVTNYTVPEDFYVFPYSIFYVYYEQYLTIVDEAIFQLTIALVPIFCVSLFMLGFSLSAPVIIIINIAMIVIDTMGVMYLWNIEFNAVSLVNLIMAVGISVEFVSHITRSFAVRVQGSRLERAEYALATMGSSVLSGVALTNLPGIIVLAFAKSQLFVVFYFRMFLVITLAGTVHGLVFLPVLLSYIGPDVNQAYLLEFQQQEDEKRRRENSEDKASMAKDHVYEQAIELEKNEKLDIATNSSETQTEFPLNKDTIDDKL